MIPYTYEIIKVDEQARVMEVVYTSEGRGSMHISARLPYQGESVEAVIDNFSPVAYWREKEAPVIVPSVGTSGAVTAPEPAPVTLESAKAAKLKEIADWRYAREVGGVTFNGVRIKTDRESQATITSAFISLSQGLASSIDWKADGGVWVPLTLNEITPIAQAVVAHVQTSFTLEKQYAQQVAVATTIEAVQAIVPETVYQV